ncbi:MAG TPA: outer membrane beta-barrel protein [Dissulfurispiraceae bacterium]|nr:outer membrane beta-barrel protein [Dissulfurispiraceae bacterium]
MKRNGILLQLGMAVVCLIFAVDYAKADIIGDTIKPFASLTGMYDSNIFRVKDKDQLRAITGDDSRMGDFIAILSVGTDVHYLISQQELNLTLKKDFMRYEHYSSQNSSADLASGNILLSLVDRLKINLLGSYVKRPELREDYQNIGLNKTTDVSGGMIISYEMPAGFELAGSYQKEKVSYSLPVYSGNEYSVDRYAGTLTYKVSTTMKVYSTIQREYTRYKEDMLLGAESINNNSTSDSIRFGVSKTFTPKTTISAYIGYLERKHREASQRDFDGIIGNAEVAYGITAKLVLLINAERLLYEEIDPFRTYSVTNSIGGGLTYDITEKTKANISDKYYWKSFKNMPNIDVSKRTDRINELSTGIKWQPTRPVTVDVGYQYVIRKSDIDSFNYNDNIGKASVAYHF